MFGVKFRMEGTLSDVVGSEVEERCSSEWEREDSFSGPEGLDLGR